MHFLRSPRIWCGLLAAPVSLPMIARELRLRNPREFEQARSTGRSWSSKLIVAVALKNELEHNRYGFAVGKRVGSAVARNRAKRLMRETIRNIHPRLSQGYDIVLIARNSVDRETSQDAINRDVEAVLRRARLVRSDEVGA